MEIEAMTRKWGNSIAIVIPSRLVAEQNLKENEKVFVKVEKRKKLKGKDIFGMFADWKRPTEEILAEADKGWD